MTDTDRLPDILARWQDGNPLTRTIYPDDIAWMAAEIERLRGEVGNASLSGDAIMLARKMLKDELGISHAFFDDCIGHAIAMVKDREPDNAD